MVTLIFFLTFSGCVLLSLPERSAQGASSSHSGSGAPPGSGRIRVRIKSNPLLLFLLLLLLLLLSSFPARSMQEARIVNEWRPAQITMAAATATTTMVAPTTEEEENDPTEQAVIHICRYSPSALCQVVSEWDFTQPTRAGCKIEAQ